MLELPAVLSEVRRGASCQRLSIPNCPGSPGRRMHSPSNTGSSRWGQTTGAALFRFMSGNKEQKLWLPYLRSWFWISHHSKEMSTSIVQGFSCQCLAKLSFAVTIGNELQMTIYCLLLCTIWSSVLLKKEQKKMRDHTQSSSNIKRWHGKQPNKILWSASYCSLVFQEICAIDMM